MSENVRVAARMGAGRERARSSVRSGSIELSYGLLFERNPQPMLAYDRRTLEIVAVSNSMVAAYGYSREELLAMTVKDLRPREEAEALRAFLAGGPGGQRPGACTQAGAPGHHLRKDGTMIDVEVTSDNVNLDGRECRIALYHDVTERNRALAELAVARDEAVEASNLKSAFLANVSHEIRTPMNGVLGMTEMLLEMGLTGEQREVAEQLARSGEQMLAIVNDVLDLSKIETGHLELDLADFDLHETIKETCSAAGAQARAKGLRLELRIADAVPRRVHADGRRLQQVLLNLIANAVKFTATGTVAVRVSATPTPRHSTMVRFEVVDSGIGIDPASLARMFEPFTQADVSTTRIYGGTGLGLAIARELVEMMGGTINAESKPGHGSTFRFELELAGSVAVDTRTAHADHDSAGAPGFWSDPPLVLVAEDSQINQIVAARARALWLPRPHSERRTAGPPGAPSAAVRRGPDGLPDARHGRLPGHRRTTPTRTRHRRPHAGDRDDRACHGRRPPTLPGRRHGRLHHQTNAVRRSR